MSTGSGRIHWQIHWHRRAAAGREICCRTRSPSGRLPMHGPPPAHRRSPDGPPGAVARILRSRGHDVDTVLEESLGGRDDPTVLSAAIGEGRMLITLDRGFGDVRAYPPGTHPGIIVMRPDDQRVPTVIATVETLVDHHDIEVSLVVSPPFSATCCESAAPTRDGELHLGVTPTAHRSVVTEPSARRRRRGPRDVHELEQGTPAAHQLDRERSRQRRSNPVQLARAARTPLQSTPSAPWR